MKYRWWMRKSGGVWRVYDLEELSGGMRVSTIMGLIAAGGINNPPPWVPHMQNMMPVMQAVGAQDFKTADQALKPLESVNFPPQLKAIVVMLRGIIQTSKGDFDGALKHYEQAITLHSDFPIIHYLRAVAYNAIEQHDKALASANKFTELLGNDALVQLEIGEALEALNRPQEAIEAYRKGNDEDSEELDNLGALARLLPASSSAELATRFRKTPDKMGALTMIGASIPHAESLEAVVAVCRKTVPATNVSLNYYEARAAMMRGDDAKAITVLKGALPRITNDGNATQYHDLLIRSYVRNKQTAEAQAQLDKIPREQRQLGWPVLVALAKNDAPGAEAALKQWHDEIGMTSPLYSDPDIGPLLNSPAFAALKAKFPPPK
jgi:tetratricopeptide (TPR) repeat protein